MSVQDEVIKDIEARKKLGLERYGTLLEPHNGRSSLQDAYEEVLDLTQYLKQRLIEDEAFRAFIRTCAERKCPCGYADDRDHFPAREWCPDGLTWLHSFASHLIGTWNGKPEEQQG